MHSLIAKVIRISHAKFQCDRRTRYLRLCESHYSDRVVDNVIIITYLKFVELATERHFVQ